MRDGQVIGEKLLASPSSTAVVRVEAADEQPARTRSGGVPAGKLTVVSVEALHACPTWRRFKGWSRWVLWFRQLTGNAQPPYDYRVRLIADQCSIVSVGAWNRAILTPDWLGDHVVGSDGKTEIELEVAPPYGLRVQSERVAALVLPQRVQITARSPDEQGLNRVMEASLNLFSALPQTPVSAVGINFGFAGDKLKEELARHFAALVQLIGTSVGTRLQTSAPGSNGTVVNVIVTHASPSVEVNFHLGLPPKARAKDAASRLRMTTVGELLREAGAIADRVLYIEPGAAT